MAALASGFPEIVKARVRQPIKEPEATIDLVVVSSDTSGICTYNHPNKLSEGFSLFHTCLLLVIQFRQEG